MAIPAFNIPFPPIMEAVVEALPETDCFGPIAVARPEWMKFEARSARAIYQEYQRVKDERFTRLHLDHLPVIDEDNLSVDYEAIIQEAIQLCHCADLKASAKAPVRADPSAGATASHAPSRACGMSTRIRLKGCGSGQATPSLLAGIPGEPLGSREVRNPCRKLFSLRFLLLV
jgi:hypothetical protein